MSEHTDNIYAAYTDDASGGGVWGTGTSPDDAIAAYAAATGSDPMDYPVLTAEMTQRLADRIEAHGFDAGRETFQVLPNGYLDIDDNADILDALNDYDGDNVWQDVIRSLPLDEARTEQLDPTGRSDVFALADGRVFAWREDRDEWTRA